MTYAPAVRRPGLELDHVELAEHVASVDADDGARRHGLAAAGGGPHAQAPASRQALAGVVVRDAEALECGGRQKTA